MSKLTTTEARTAFWLRMRNRYYEEAGEATTAKGRATWLARAAHAERTAAA